MKYSIFLILLGAHLANADCRLRDPNVYYCNLLEHNIVINPDTNKIRLNQIVAYNFIDRYGYLELVPVDYLLIEDFCEETALNDIYRYGIKTKSGNTVYSRSMYKSITSFDIERIKRDEMKYYGRTNLFGRRDP